MSTEPNIDVDICLNTWLYDEMTQKTSERERADEILRAISEGTALAKGEEFFRSLVRHLAAALQARYAFVTECTDVEKTQVRTLAFWNDHNFTENISYAVSGTPCENVMSGQVCFHPTGVQTLFPQDESLVKWSAYSYLGVPIYGSSGHVLGHLAVLDEKPLRAETQDISILRIFAGRAGVELERQRAEDTLRESEERYRSLYTKTPVMLHSNDAEGRLLSVSDHWLKTLGYQRNEVIGQISTTFLSETSREYAKNICFPKFMETGTLIDEPLQFKKKNGEIIDVLLSAIVERDADDNVVRSLAVSIDVTQRKRAEETVKRYTKRLETLQEIDRAVLAARSPEAIAQAALQRLRQLVPCVCASVIIFDFERDEGRIVAIDSQSETGLALGSRLPLDAFSRLDALRRGTVNVVDDALNLPDQPYGINVPLLTQGELIGSLNLGSNAAHAFPTEHIDVAREVADSLAVAIQQAYLHDEVKRQAAELEQRVAERTAELEAFSYSVSHDLRAPLRAIDGFSRVLLEDYGDKLDPECKRLLNIICSSANNMGQLIDDLLAFSRLGRQEIKLSTVDMGELVRTVVDEMRLSPSAAKVEVKLGTLPSARGDPAMLRQVFANLLSNGIKFTQPKDTPRIEIGHKNEDNETIYYVKDNGVGFDMRYVDKIFGVFQRLHSVDEFAGTGVGLAIVHAIIQRHGGRIWAEGRVDQGATIFFTLPRGTKTW